MDEKRRLLLFALAALLFVFCAFLLVALALAAPLPPLRVVNHQTKECGEIFGGDECMDCFPPAGWENLGFASDVPCPEGYTVVENVDSTCQGFKAQFCCTEGHSGAAGHCEDLVMNDKKKQCAFVDDIQTCALPTQWTRKPDSVDVYGWACPADYEWLDSLGCQGQEGGEEQPTAESGGGQATPESGGEQTGTRCLPCLGTTLVGPALVGLWLLLKGRR